MKKGEIEAWVLRVVEQVRVQQPNEDSRVELKTEWIDPRKAARLIAGQANAAHGEPILWIIGLNQDLGIIGAQYEELAIWYEKVKAQFNGLAPEMTDMNISIDDRTLVALLFETDRAPFVIRNPLFGARKGGIEYEVPWRENTSTRTANRSQLIKLLSPLQFLPDLEVLSGDLIASPPKEAKENELEWKLHLEFYISTNRSEPHIFIPFHRCKASFYMKGEIHSYPLEPLVLSASKDSLTISATRTEIRVEGPGIAHLHGYTLTNDILKEDLINDIEVNVTLPVIGAEAPITLAIIMRLKSTFSPNEPRAIWTIKGNDQ